MNTGSLNTVQSLYMNIGSGAQKVWENWQQKSGRAYSFPSDGPDIDGWRVTMDSPTSVYAPQRYLAYDLTENWTTFKHGDTSYSTTLFRSKESIVPKQFTIRWFRDTTTISLIFEISKDGSNYTVIGEMGCIDGCKTNEEVTHVWDLNYSIEELAQFRFYRCRSKAISPYYAFRMIDCSCSAWYQKG